jgi:hypothetical protein
MDTISIQLINPKAGKILEDLEELGLIKILKEGPKTTQQLVKIKAPVNEEEIDKRLREIRKECQRDIL